MKILLPTIICASLSQVVICVIFWDLGKKQEPKISLKKQEQYAAVLSNEDNLFKKTKTMQPRLSQIKFETVINEDIELKKKQKPQKNSDTCSKHGHPDSDYNSDESEDEEPCTVHNCTEARRQFRILTEGMEEE